MASNTELAIEKAQLIKDMLALEAEMFKEGAENNPDDHTKRADYDKRINDINVAILDAVDKEAGIE
mgnify:CR=1 FL=1|tara:strand:- start:648 stop:845 length:198 start_codon:yes stop_codon:yes gene_type:complete